MAERLPGYTHEETAEIMLAGSVQAIRDSIYMGTAIEPATLFLPKALYRPAIAEFLGIPVIAVTGIDKPMLSYAVEVVP